MRGEAVTKKGPFEEGDLCGPYEIVRHPMYFSLILMMIGIAAYNSGATNSLGLIMVTVSVFLKARKEEEILVDHFEGYREYQARTHMIVPRLY